MQYNNDRINVNSYESYIQNGRPDMNDSARKISVLKNTGKLIGVMALTLFLTQSLLIFGAQEEIILMIYFLSVLIVSVVTPKFMYGILAALISSFAYDFFTIEPFYAINYNEQFPIFLVMMLIVTFLTGALTMPLKYQAELAHRRELRTETLFGLSQALAEAGDAASIARVITDCLKSFLTHPVILFVDDPKKTPRGSCAPAADGSADIFFTDGELSRIHSVFVRGSTDILEMGEEQLVHYEPVAWSGGVLGVIGVYCDSKFLNQWNRNFISIISRISAHSLALQRAHAVHDDLRVASEREKIRSNLLRSISHDLRTPLTSILGASTAIFEQPDIKEATRNDLLRDIQENTRWLIRMVENILTVTKISQDTIQLNKSMEAAEEVMSQAVSIVRARFPYCLIHLKIPDELVMVPMDATLISQVIINLLENAVKNSYEGELVLFTLAIKDRFALFEISDHGGGIPEHMLDNLFEIHATNGIAADASRGFGIGLSICRTIVHAHGGLIEGANREKGGAKFRFMLPLEDAANGNGATGSSGVAGAAGANGIPGAVEPVGRGILDAPPPGATASSGVAEPVGRGILDAPPSGTTTSSGVAEPVGRDAPGAPPPGATTPEKDEHEHKQNSGN